jgi:predicted nuclease of predicted toxin-antitoxin system
MQLRASGHDVISMSDVAPRATDAEVMSRANSEIRLLLTEDKDFGDLVFRQARPVPAIVLLQIDSTRRSHKGARLLTGSATICSEIIRSSKPLDFVPVRCG